MAAVCSGVYPASYATVAHGVPHHGECGSFTTATQMRHEQQH